MPQDITSRLQSLLAELEALPEDEARVAEIRTRRSEILQSILQLFAANSEGAQLEFSPTESDVRH
jgi:hypothetical protein